MVFEKIKVQLELLTDKFNQQLKSGEEKMKKFNSQVQRQNTIFRKSNAQQKANKERLRTLTEQTHGFGQVMGMSQERFKAFNQQGFKFKTIGGRMANSMRMVTHGMRGFRMEALGVMFFGMSIQKMFMGLLRPVMDAFGVFDLFRLMLLVLFLPIMEVIFPYFLKFIQWFMDLPGPVKKAIGIFALVGVVLGSLLMIFGTLILGVGSFILMFGKLFGVSISLKAVFLGIKVAILGVSGTMLAIIGIIILIIIGMVIAWKENFLGMKKIVSDFTGGIKDFFKGILKFFKGIFLIIKGIFLGDWSDIWEGVKMIFIGAGQVIWGLIKILVNGIAAIMVGIIRIVWSIIKLVIAPFKWLYDKLVGHSIIPDMINAIIGWFQKLPNAIKSVVRIIGNAFIGVGNSIIGVFNLVMSGIGNAIATVLKGVDVMIGVINKIPGVNIGKYKWNISWGNLPKIPYLADGGIVNKPTLAMVGESGPEAVIPLNRDDSNLGGNITNNFYGFTIDELKRELDNRDRRVIDDLRRLVKT